VCPQVFDRDCKGYVFTMPGTGLRMQTPPDSRASLNLAHPYLVLQVCWCARRRRRARIIA